MPQLLRKPTRIGGCRDATTVGIGGVGRCGGGDCRSLFILCRDKPHGGQGPTPERDLEPAQGQVGHAPDSVECPDSLEGKVGATTRCTLKDGDQTYGVGVNVTKVEGTDVKFDIKVDDQPQ